ncbi:DUF1513 domain-containing protein [Pelagimonas varians]|uniref:Twin-arginine translocation pathway signal n=1 Tax=Pelagimonas varians TaxID=696760 RepID=A0A238L464_9RHOB|nr:DUF1513 domain-containing protein [Pelagimonas varians]PYG26730.1 hypothetical protein C8N36_12073 [Pelagimonas varians]SMX49202.1 hypothetical protein PEV8663_04128 [Pelagimonas varians]
MGLPNNGRRQFLGGLLAAGIVPQMTWADAGSPAFLSAAVKPDGNFVLCGIGEDLSIRFELPLPARGHAAAAHPTRPEAVAFARRPGTFAVVIDCMTGAQKAVLTSPEGRHFYGHGAFSSDGRLLFTTENDYEAGRGCIGVWDAQKSYVRIDEWDSGGIGPHDIKRIPGTDTLVVANGGIDTHPDTGRTKLNIATMEPNLAYIEAGQVIGTASFSAEWHKCSIRHLDVSQNGTVAFGMQWQGDGPVDMLVGTHRYGEKIDAFAASPQDMRNMQGYIGSIASSADGRFVAVTSPRGGMVQIYDVLSAMLVRTLALEDVCGISVCGDWFVATAGTGALRSISKGQQNTLQAAEFAWDNHLVRI